MISGSANKLYRNGRTSSNRSGPPKLASQLDGQAFLAQARAYSQRGWNWLKMTRTLPLTHPLPVLRAHEIDRWSQSPDYQRLVAGEKN